MAFFFKSEKEVNIFMLGKLIVDHGGEALRITLRKQMSGTELFFFLNTTKNRNKLLRIKKKIIRHDAWILLYPDPPRLPDENDFDITLLCVLLRTICNLKQPNNPIWTNKPNATDHSTEADITRIRLYRNECYAHIPNTSFSLGDFETLWKEVCQPIVRLGISQQKIDQLNQERTQPILCLVGNETTVRNPSFEFGADILTNNLVSCNFECDISNQYETFLHGTREWVFDEFLAWFEDNTSQNRAFVISAVAGMGKSAIAATLCKRYPSYFAAVHFFQHNDSRFNDANVLLQSLARQIARNFPAYEKLLEVKLRNVSEPLRDMNVERLFSFLFTELFEKITEFPKRTLIMLDALDECGYPESLLLADLLDNHLFKLPPCFYFVITTRPNKDCHIIIEKLNPLFINFSDDDNLNDVKLLIDERIGPTNRVLHLKENLLEKSDGLMLLASLLSSKIKNQDSFNGSIPKDLNEYYEISLKRISDELDSFQISKEKFQSLLNTLAVAKEPLPWEVVEDILNFNCVSSVVREIMLCLFATNAEGHVSFFHKSLSDWLAGECKHNYSVNTTDGNRVVLAFCSRTLDNLKAVDVDYNNFVKRASVMYSVKYWFLHMIAICDNDHVVEYVGKYLVDLDVLLASVSIDRHRTLENFRLISSHNIYFHLSEGTRLLFNDIYCAITRHFMNSIIFLQYVVNEIKDLAPKASTMLQTRFRESSYVERLDTHFVLNPFLRLARNLISVNVSRNYDYVVCGYEGFIVQLFSLTTNRCLWIKDISDQLSLSELKGFCVVFHPFTDLIFVSQLDKVLNVDRKVVSSPFHCDDSTCKFFTNSCFPRISTQWSLVTKIF
ncbi:uncharacterized protein LOC124451460 isoform X1 [Xenia sp. Carnegie-2017]|uniref:uncharacterized protein LOC124451460 isoform X1 n=1 Tax=Xenia sp. Carnegie-2017 TaxID=2897299 RepID=UPI001F03E387|nr:uncharacterized protein LOC124451460 isoform X1 [Xenia sp. Carnegie-2017]XP_046858038.1 uncharacterized protein LOC124451460 isoform X1 [Xenia sp. Carnegie-2017]XP_046858039.1 uncharacterized protein LOC124451460 isoform X1 [Xenia sp. Carnegie-2017]XP_046858040.1 uncharacterized protein LOC124451460 isoform X1 [Xenia sp. Carnegie-2017]XP_046858041.1 uncharacterized protein LOC124451460 isoform X1 [Xenia sp. Carnegie-2017]XP_046858042.1 uncharacterized protein LOC124451460 isoform X1 [Xenia 